VHSKKRNILLTFDYELYLGRSSGTARKCLLEPTNRLLSIFERYGCSGIFFVDTLGLASLRQNPETRKEYEEVAGQLRSLHEKGNYIFPHVHPHWLDAAFDLATKQFSLANISRYSLAAFTAGEVEKLIGQSIALLQELGISYDHWGYRAGGWCIQPFSLFKPAFTSLNIRYDFSVMPGYKNDHPEQKFDFSDVELNAPYAFENEVNKPANNGAFTEFPISALQLGKSTLFFNKLMAKYLWKRGDRGWGDGRSAQTAALVCAKENSEMISLDLLTSTRLPAYKSFLANNEYMHWISHPKMFTRHALKTFESFVAFAHKNFEPQYDFKKISL
jgi:hypothetical protein